MKAGPPTPHMPYPVLNIANRLLELAGTRGKQPLDPLKLQKLVYLAHGWYLAFTGKPLIDGGFEAWQYGPVNPVLYREFKDFRANSITRPAKTAPVPIPSEVEHILNEVIRVYGGKSGLDLSGLTHQQGSAWRAVYNGSAWSSPTIPDYLIKAEFEKRRADGRE